MNSRILIYYILLFTSSSILSQEVQYFDSYEISERLPVQDLTFDHRTLLWCHFKQSCATFDGVDFNFTKLSGLENQDIKFLGQIEDQTLFYSNENIHSKHRKTGLVISNLLPNQKRDIEWVKSYGDSIYLYNNNKLELYLFSDNKLNLVYNVIVSNIQDLVKTEDGQLFIATKAGLRVLLDGTLVAESKLQQLFKLPLKRIFLDHYQNLWFISQQDAVYKYNGQRLQEIQIAQDSTEYNFSDGLLENNSLWLLDPSKGVIQYNLRNGSSQLWKLKNNPVLNEFTELEVDHFGHLWLAGLGGLLRIDKTPTVISPEVFIKDIKVLFNSIELVKNEQHSPLFNQLILSPNENYISFEFDGGNLASDAVQFQYILDGRDQAWTPWNNETKVNYSSLAPGTYNFKVRAKTQGKISETSSGIFIIEAPLWEKKKIRNLALGLFSLVLVSIFIWIWTAQKRKLNKLSEALKLKETSLEWQQKALQLQMNPHFIFNVLNSIKGLIAENRSKDARQSLQEFSDFLRSMLNQSRASSISIKNEIEFIQNYLSIENMMRSTKFDIKLDIEPKLHGSNHQIFAMMVQPFLENAIHHGFKGINHSGILAITIRLLGKNIEFIMEDNGVGRVAANEKKDSTHKSQAMKVIEDRLASIKSDKLERISVTDLYDAEQKPAGTAVRLILPILEPAEKA